MAQNIFVLNLQLYKTMNKKHVEEILKAILARKYSWACVLMLRFYGYDPLHYLPYRTYIRLVKENYQSNSENPNNPDSDLDLLEIKSKKFHSCTGER